MNPCSDPSPRVIITGRKKPFYRPVPLSEEIPGSLFLGPVPCQYESGNDFEKWVHDTGISIIACLISNYEIGEKSPEYRYVIDNKKKTWRHWQFPVEDYGVPSRREDYFAFAFFVALSIFYGEQVLIHCRAGIGRTGTLSIIVQMMLGVSMEEARIATRSAGGCPENEDQWDLIREIRDRLFREGLIPFLTLVSDTEGDDYRR